MQKLKLNSIYLLLLLTFTAFTFQSCSDDDDDFVCEYTYSGSTSAVTQVAENHYSVYTDIVIDANIETVWTVLTNFDNMPNWSTTFQGLSGDITNGGEIVAIFLVTDPSTGNTVPAEFPHTLSYTEGVQFGWSDPIALFPGITDNHLYKLEALSDCQTRFIQTDEFSGTDDNITAEIMAQVSGASYNQFNAELKAEVEQ